MKLIFTSINRRITHLRRLRDSALLNEEFDSAKDMDVLIENEQVRLRDYARPREVVCKILAWNQMEGRDIRCGRYTAQIENEVVKLDPFLDDFFEVLLRERPIDVLTQLKDLIGQTIVLEAYPIELNDKTTWFVTATGTEQFKVAFLRPFLKSIQ